MTTTGTLVTFPNGRSYVADPIGDTQPRALLVAAGGTFQDAAWLQANTHVRDVFNAWGAHIAWCSPAVGGRWNAGPGWTSSGQDDTAYFAAVIDDMAARAGVAVDPGRVFGIGYSAGGATMYRAAGQDDRWRAISMVSGFALVDPIRPFGLFALHGWNDTTVPMLGGAGFEGFVFPAWYHAFQRMKPGDISVPYPHAGGHEAMPGAGLQSYRDYLNQIIAADAEKAAQQ